MIISIRKRFVFVHIPKTAGSSIYQALRPFNDAPDTDENRHLELSAICSRYGYLALENENEVPPNGPQTGLGPLGDFFKFAFVRNPWDRVLSMYCYRLQNQEIPPHVSFYEFVMNRRSYPFGMHREQVALIKDPGRGMVMDFIGRFENLQQDWQEIQRRLDISAGLPHFKQTRHRHYRTYYNQELIEEVSRMYPQDIELLEYQF